MRVFAKASASSSRSKRTLLSSLAIAGASALVLAGCATDGGTTSEPAGDLALKLGTALPVTGNLAFLGPPEKPMQASRSN
jgi:branched-chain amino acid transport system substrate-binding protein